MQHSGSRKLVFVNLFFWRPGSLLQHSTNGLLKALVGQMMHSSTDLIPAAFPIQWQQLHGKHDFRLEVPQVFDAEPLDEEHTLNAFHRLLQDANIRNTHRFCFFIDALDEHNDSSQ